MGEFLRRAELPVALTFALPRTRGNGKLSGHMQRSSMVETYEANERNM
jgi:hypothetical protein